MKRFLKKSWIAILALATTVVAACSSSRHTGKTDDPQNNNPSVNSDDNTSTNDTITAQRAEVQRRLEELRKVIEEREMSCVYGSPEIIQRYGEETQRLRSEADSLQNLLDNGYGASNGKKKISELKKHLKELESVINDRETSEVYGSPEVMDSYNAETQELRREAAEIQRQIDELEGKKNTVTRPTSRGRRDVDSVLEETIPACIYGSPEVMQGRGPIVLPDNTDDDIEEPIEIEE